MGEIYDAPNQQAVRPDGSHPSQEGTGGGEAPADQAPKKRRAKKDEPEPEQQPAAEEGAG